MSNNAPRILAFAGSTREDSYNKRLVRIAAAAAEEAAGRVRVIDLRDYPLPLYDGDLERREGLPDKALELKELLSGHQGWLISSPEYNSSVTGVLKNAIDWASRKASPDEGRLSAFQGKVAALMSASPGGMGGLRGLVHLRAILGNLGVLVLPQQKAIARAHQAFDEEGQLQGDADREAIEGIAWRLVEVTRKLGKTR